MMLGTKLSSSKVLLMSSELALGHKILEVLLLKPFKLFRINYCPALVLNRNVTQVVLAKILSSQLIGHTTNGLRYLEELSLFD
jgi:hypothetical protein